MHKLKVTLGKYWVEAFCCYFFEHEGFEALSFPSEGIFPLESRDSVWKAGWSVSIFMSDRWDSSFGIPILQEQKANANQLFIAGALTLAEYNQIVDTHNQSVELFEELCGSAPELYL